MCLSSLSRVIGVREEGGGGGGGIRMQGRFQGGGLRYPQSRYTLLQGYVAYLRSELDGDRLRALCRDVLLVAASDNECWVVAGERVVHGFRKNIAEGDLPLAAGGDGERPLS